jgi:solute:Na+ symporter, SSS family
MSSTAITAFIICTSIVIFISWYKTRKDKPETSGAHFLANRKLGFLTVGGALFFTNISATQFIGENESVYISNMAVMAWGMTSILAMLIVSEFFIPRYLRSGITTTPDFLEERYDAGTKKIVSVIFLASYLINLLPYVLYSGAVAFEGLFNVSGWLKIDYRAAIWILVWVMGLTGFVFSLAGGMKAIAISDTVMGIGMFIGCILLPYFGLKYLGSGNVQAGITIILSSNREHINSIGSSKDVVPFATLFTGMILVNLYYWGMEQYIVQQVLASKSLAESQKGMALACTGKIISPLMLNIPGLIAVHLYTNMKNTAGVFPKMVSDVSPPLLTGYMAAIIFWAALTTFNAGLNSVGTLFTLNIYKPAKLKRNKAVDEKQLMRAGKRFQIIASLLAMFTSPVILFTKNGFYNYIQTAGGFFSVPILTILLIGFVTKRVPPAAAKIGLVFFISCYALTQLVFDTGIHFLHILAILFLITSAMMLLIGKLYPMKIPYKQQLNNLVDMQPWKNRHFYSVILLLLMVVIFAIFSPIGLIKSK